MRAEQIQSAITAITSIDDPAERGRAATDVLKVIHDGNKALARVRREAVLELRRQKMTYREIGPAIGVHYSRVKQIEIGEATGINAKPKNVKDGT